MTPPSLPIDPDVLRVFAYDRIVDDGHVPTVAEIGAHFGVTTADARDAVRGIGIGKTLLAHPESGEIWMAGPFAAVPSPYRVTSRGRAWWANCAWVRHRGSFTFSCRPAGGTTISLSREQRCHSSGRRSISIAGC